MLEGMYTAAAGMAAQQQRLDALSNDLANVNTVGYKRVRVAFRDLVYTPSGPGGRPGVTEGSGAAASAIGRSSLAGALKQTGEPLDVAITGPGFLQVRRPDGTNALTRDGQLTVDARRRLNAGGLPLQPPVRIPNGVQEKDVAISPDGRIDAGGANVGRVNLLTVRAPDRLSPVGDSLFTTNAASGAATRAGAGTTLQQGALEQSNVDIGDAMTDMIATQRNYSLASRAIDMADQMAQMANGIKK
ncbi:flagellar hook-basal body protein [Capillimicrobium parvum]|uniref:Flagellar basal-body rod protein FlgG n=1 Tax=Capillimicrobium parvum TaxID=2884022 RepID=A0A9E6XRT9_9ACTN|nr:flagellar hook-basal body protein [Capillimicrobium parvum]UGS33693.1 Flagellar basal-body rod protein FlgG [Capillimicrobium parvum]